MAAEVEHAADGPRLNLTGEEAELLARHRGEPIKARQHVVDMAFGRDLADEKRIFIDALGYRLTEEELNVSFDRFKVLCDKKKEIYDEDIIAIVEDQLESTEQLFKLKNLQVVAATAIEDIVARQRAQ